MTDFLYVVSHDLRAPLINLEGFSRALEDTVGELGEKMTESGDEVTGKVGWSDVKEELDESLEFILSSVAKMDMLVKGLLELSRIETRDTLQQRIDSQEVVKHILATLQFQITERGAAVTVDEGLPTLKGDPLRINQVFSNLIDNAVKYLRPEGEAKIHIGVAQENGFYHFSVSDTGPGIREEDLEKVFPAVRALGPQWQAGRGDWSCGGAKDRRKTWWAHLGRFRDRRG